jgi:hypothetical protein
MAYEIVSDAVLHGDGVEEEQVSVIDKHSRTATADIAP